MPSITFRSPDDTPALVMGDLVPPGPLREKIGEGEMSNRKRDFHPGGPEALQMFEVEMEPNGGPHPHAHAEDEIMFVLEGEMHFGRRVLTPGCSAYIPAYTLYSFRAGPQGLRFLNFRGRKDSAYFTTEELRARQAAGATAP